MDFGPPRRTLSREASGVLRFITFGVLGDAPVPVWCDNEVCVMVTKDQSSIKRLAYVARRVPFLQELHARGIIEIRKVEMER